MPANYGVSMLYLALRIDERFGQQPGWFDSLPAGKQAVLLAFERVRGAEGK